MCACTPEQADKQVCSPLPMKKMACQIARGKRPLTTLRERTDSTTTVTWVPHSQGRGRAVPCPLAGEARVEEESVSVAGAWANARVDQPEPPGQRKPSVCEAPGLVESRAAAHLWLGRGLGKVSIGGRLTVFADSVWPPHPTE